MNIYDIIQVLLRADYLVNSSRDNYLIIDISKLHFHGVHSEQRSNEYGFYNERRYCGFYILPSELYSLISKSRLQSFMKRL